MSKNFVGRCDFGHHTKSTYKVLCHFTFQAGVCAASLICCDFGVTPRQRYRRCFLHPFPLSVSTFLRRYLPAYLLRFSTLRCFKQNFWQHEWKTNEYEKHETISKGKSSFGLAEQLSGLALHAFLYQRPCTKCDWKTLSMSKTFLSFPKENMRGNGRRRHTKENERGKEWIRKKEEEDETRWNENGIEETRRKVSVQGQEARWTNVKFNCKKQGQLNSDKWNRDQKGTFFSRVPPKQKRRNRHDPAGAAGWRNFFGPMEATGQLPAWGPGKVRGKQIYAKMTQKLNSKRKSSIQFESIQLNFPLHISARQKWMCQALAFWLRKLWHALCSFSNRLPSVLQNSRAQKSSNIHRRQLWRVLWPLFLVGRISLCNLRPFMASSFFSQKRPLCVQKFNGPCYRA